MSRRPASAGLCQDGVLARNHCADSLEMGIRFAQWAAQHPHPLCPQLIVDRYAVSRATAYRWRAAWAAANGVVYPHPQRPQEFVHTPQALPHE